MSISNIHSDSQTIDMYLTNINKESRSQEIVTEFKGFYDPSNPEAVRDATIKTALKIAVNAGLAFILPTHWVTGVAFTWRKF